MKAGWRQLSLGEVADVIAGQSPEGRYYNAEGQGVPFYQGKKDFGDKYLEPPATWTTQRTKMAVAGDILMSVRAPVGPVNFSTQEICIGRGLAAIRARGSIERNFLFYQLLSLQDSLSGRDGAVFPSINRADIQAIPLIVPPMSEQRRIVAILDEAFEDIAKARANTEKNIENATAVFESQLEEVFSSSDSWVTESLGGCCEMYQPKTIGTKDLVDDGPYPVFGANGIIGRYDKYNHEQPQLLVTCRGATCGSVNVSDPFSWITGNAMVVRPKDARIDFGFLEFALRGGIDLSPAITGAAQPQITRTNLSPLVLRYPGSIAQQRRLAEQFRRLRDVSDALSRVCYDKAAALEELKKSLLHHAFAGEL